jgi:6,7-dimethyl-8-ribityllumazine synthase
MSKHRPAPPPQPAQVPFDARIAVVSARFNGHIVEKLLAGCVARLREVGLSDDRVAVHHVPGAFELPVAAKLLIDTRQYSAVICLGCVIRGETAHFEHVAGQAAAGIQQVAIATGIPIIFGVLTTETEDQAQSRAGGAHGHAGISAADAAVEMIALASRLKVTT